MKRLRFALLGLSTFLLVTLGSTFKKLLAVSLCSLLIAGGAVCYSWASSDRRVQAAMPTDVVSTGDRDVRSGGEPSQGFLNAQAGEIPVIGMLQLMESNVETCPVDSYEIEGHFSADYTAFTLDRTEGADGCFGQLPRQLFESTESMNSGEAVIYQNDSAGPNGDLLLGGQLTMFGDGLWIGGFMSGAAEAEKAELVGTWSLNKPERVLDTQNIPGSIAQLPEADNPLAIPNLPDLDVAEDIPDTHWRTHKTGLVMSRTLIDVMLEEDATIKQLNDALKAVGGVIVSSISDLPGIMVAVPNTGDNTGDNTGYFRGIDRAEAIFNFYPGISFTSPVIQQEVPILENEEEPLVSNHRNDEHFTMTSKGYETPQKTSDKPADSSRPSEPLSGEDCQRGGRGGNEVVPTPLLLEGLTDVCGKLWEDLDKIDSSNEVVLVVYDKFEGDEHEDLNLDVLGNYAGSGGGHGYMVSGLMAAKSGNGKGVIGAYPNPEDFPAIKAIQVDNMPLLLKELKTIFPTNGNFNGKRAIVNYSQNSASGRFTTIAENPQLKTLLSLTMTRAGVFWSSQIRALGENSIEDHLLITATAGNKGPNLDPANNSYLTAAALKSKPEIETALKQSYQKSALIQLQKICEIEENFWGNEEKKCNDLLYPEEVSFWLNKINLDKRGPLKNILVVANVNASTGMDRNNSSSGDNSSQLVRAIGSTRDKDVGKIPKRGLNNLHVAERSKCPNFWRNRNGIYMLDADNYTCTSSVDTSGAAPQVAGLAAYIWNKNPGYLLQDKNGINGIITKIRNSQQPFEKITSNDDGKGILSCELSSVKAINFPAALGVTMLYTQEEWATKGGYKVSDDVRWKVEKGYLDREYAESIVAPGCLPEESTSQQPKPVPQDPSHSRTGNVKSASNFGDPHLFTFDDYRYSFQLVGEFILAKSDDNLFEVQVRQVPISSSLAVDSAIAMGVGGDRVAIYADDFPDSNTNNPLRINGQAVEVNRRDPLELSGGGKVYHNGSNYVVEWPTGEEVVVSIRDVDQQPFLNITAYVFESQANHIFGLFGNVNGDREDDLRFRDGRQLETRSTYGDLEGLIDRVIPISDVLDPALKLYFDKLSNDYGRDWRISQEESLFDYAPGKNTQTYNLGGFPAEYLTLNLIPESRLRAARQTCFDEDVAADFLEGCVFDVAFSGFNGFARAAAQASRMQDILEDFGINLPIEIPEDPDSILEEPEEILEDIFRIF